MLKKRIFAVFCAVVVISLSIVQCFADTWGEEVPVYEDYLALSVEEASSNSNREVILDMVELSYNIGMFGGSFPAAIIYNYQGSDVGYYVEVITPAPQFFDDYSYFGNAKDVIKAGFAVPYGESYGQLFISFPDEPVVSIVIWRLSTSGDWYIVDYVPKTESYFSETSIRLSNSAIGSGSVNSRKVAVYHTRFGTWKNGEDWSGDYAIGGDFTSVAVSASALAVKAKYQDQVNLLSMGSNSGQCEDQYELGYQAGYIQGLANGSPNELNIPSIFDSMFNGVRSIMSTFDIEIFGISIIGTLVAVLVIAIIAFVVRKLWR